MDVGTYMGMALGHPQFGYYMHKDPFGAEGDFTTAPEVSQMFGELLGAWVVDIWQQMGRPERFHLVECGPGRGTLMADIVRVMGQFGTVLEAANIHLLEMSPVMKALQKEALQEQDFMHHETLETVPYDAPVVMLANEFLDALPVRQIQKTKGGVVERVIGLDEHEGLCFGYRDVDESLFVDVLHGIEPGQVVEISSVRAAYVHNMTELLRAAGGMALFIDYGYRRPGYGDTFQALYKHKPCHVLEHVGQADLTAHVDFLSLSEQVMEAGALLYGPVEQGGFLKRLGIEERAGVLMQNASEDQRKDIEAALKRLTHPDEMGSLFLVMGVAFEEKLQPVGF
jgi:NADH dehydrogenase [ubiquinone] 1 alpha subcomplex assembly factor 7